MLTPVHRSVLYLTLRWLIRTRKLFRVWNATPNKGMVLQTISSYRLYYFSEMMMRAL